MSGRGRRRSDAAHAVVTGAGSGIGRSFARLLASRGGQVLCADIDPAGAKETVALIEADGGRAFASDCDVTQEQQVQALADTSTEWFGRPPNLVINNAGIGAGGTGVGETSLADWRATLAVNLWGVIHGCHVFTPVLREQSRAGIINVASAAGFAAAPKMAAYNVSKAGVLALSETLAAELSGTGVAVTVLCPTFVKTNIISADTIDAGAARLAERAMRLVGSDPDRIARTTVDANDRGRLYVVPQLDAQLVWRAKRLLPTPYARGAGLLGRLLPD